MPQISIQEVVKEEIVVMIQEVQRQVPVPMIQQVEVPQIQQVAVPQIQTVDLQNFTHPFFLFVPRPTWAWAL